MCIQISATGARVLIVKILNMRRYRYMGVIVKSGPIQTMFSHTQAFNTKFGRIPLKDGTKIIRITNMEAIRKHL